MHHVCDRAIARASLPLWDEAAAFGRARFQEEATMIAQAAHEEEGSREFGGVLGPYPEGSGPNIVPPLESLCDCGTACDGLREECDVSASACDVRPFWAFMEEFRLSLLSACTGLFDRDAFPAS
jgi:hypothetical protein